MRQKRKLPKEATPKSTWMQRSFIYEILNGERDGVVRLERRARFRASREVLGRERRPKDVLETFVRRSFGEFTFEAILPKGGIRVAFQRSRATEIAAQCKEEREVLDAHGRVGGIRLRPGMDVDRFASRGLGGGQISRRDEIAREIVEHGCEHGLAGAGSRRRQRAASDLDRSLRLTPRVLGFGQI